MPVHVEEMTSEVAVLEGELPLSKQQLDKLVQLVMQRLAEQQREMARRKAATSLRHSAQPPTAIGGRHSD